VAEQRRRPGGMAAAQLQKSWHIGRTVLRPGCRWLAVLLVVGPLAVLASAARPAPATSSRQARADALRTLPLEEIEPELRAKVHDVVHDPSIYRCLSVQVTDCDPQLYLFLLRNPDLVVNMWRVMGVSKVDLQRVDDVTFQANDHSGTTGKLHYCHSSDNLHVVYGEGQYDGPVFDKPVRARCVMVLKSAYAKDANQRYLVTSRMDTFITIDQVGLELLAKTFQPLVTRSADYNFRETAAFVGDVSRTAESNYKRLMRLNDRLTKVDEALRVEFARLSQEVARRSAARDESMVDRQPAVGSKSPVIRTQNR
jgi:hypothetical protein